MTISFKSFNLLGILIVPFVLTLKPSILNLKYLIVAILLCISFHRVLLLLVGIGKAIHYQIHANTILE